MTEYIGVMHQAPYLFRTTILNNIRIGREEASEAEVWAVLEKVGLKEMVAHYQKVYKQWWMKQVCVFLVANDIAWR